MAEQAVLNNDSAQQIRRIIVYTTKRLMWSLLVIFAIAILIFIATQILPGDAAEAILGREAATQARVEALRQQLNLDQPFLMQFWSWFQGILRLDLGTSLSNGLPVTEYLGSRIQNTMILVLLASLVSFPIAIALGVYTGYRSGGLLDKTTTASSLVVVALPEFVLGTILILLFSTGLLHWLPATAANPSLFNGWDHFSGLVLPTLTLAIAIGPYVIRMTRGVTQDILKSEFISYARLSGETEQRVLFSHTLRNGLSSVVQVVALQIAYLAGGVVVIEYLFSYPGVGIALVEAVQSRDLPIIQAATLFLAVFYILINLAADVISMILNPRSVGD